MCYLVVILSVISAMKLTQEIVDQWLESAWRDGFNKGVNGEDNLPDFKSLMPSVKTTYEESSKLPFNPSKCEARVLKDGYGVQCSRSPFGDGCLCKTHQKKFDGLADGLDIPFGRYNKERPTHSLDLPDGGNKIAWHDTKLCRSSPDKSSTKGPKLKVGELRDYLSTRIPNENFKGMKKSELKDLYDKEKERELQEDSRSDDSSESNEDTQDEDTREPETPVDKVEGNVVESVKEKVEELIGKVEKAEEPVEDAEEPVKKVEEPVEDAEEPIEDAEEPVKKVEEPVEDAGEKKLEEKVNSGMGTLVETCPKSKSDFVKLFKKLGIDDSDLSGVRAYKLKYTEFLKEEEENGEETEDMSDEDADDLDEDKSSFDKIDFEGVEYLEDEDSGKLYNTKFKLVGEWNANCDDIIWISDKFKGEHEDKSC